MKVIKITATLHGNYSARISLGKEAKKRMRRKRSPDMNHPGCWSTARATSSRSRGQYRRVPLRVQSRRKDKGEEVIS